MSNIRLDGSEKLREGELPCKSLIKQKIKTNNQTTIEGKTHDIIGTLIIKNKSSAIKVINDLIDEYNIKKGDLDL